MKTTLTIHFWCDVGWPILMRFERSISTHGAVGIRRPVSSGTGAAEVVTSPTPSRAGKLMDREPTARISNGHRYRRCSQKSSAHRVIQRAHASALALSTTRHRGSFLITAWEKKKKKRSLSFVPVTVGGMFLGDELFRSQNKLRRDTGLDAKKASRKVAELVSMEKASVR